MKESPAKKTILVVDDSVNTLEILERNLSSGGFRTLTATSVMEAIDVLESTAIDLVITDLKMPGQSGMELVRHVRDNFKNTEVMMITGYASVAGAVEAVKTGAEEYLAKPFTDKELFEAVGRTLKKLERRRKVDAPEQKEQIQYQGLIGRSAAMQKVFNTISKAARTSATVLIVGESGTGKELVARAIHYISERSTSAFIPINSGGIPDGLLESELFGYVKGAFTGAVETRAGFFQVADGGTIFLDEIGEIPPSMQVKLLRILQDGEVCMVGDTRTRKVDVRIIAATNKDLMGLIKKGSFREDLFFRLNVINIHIPPLREREDDILLLTDHFLEKFAREASRPRPAFSQRALGVLQKYHWPGNVRELGNVIQRLVVMSDDQTLDAPDLPEYMRFSAMTGSGLNRSLTEMETGYIRRVLENVGGNKSKAAKILEIDRKTLREKMKRYGIGETDG